ncbi:MAG: N-acetylglucosamine kinase [Planctomycetota bacterium]
MNLFVGVDGGGTKTRAVVADLNHNVLASGAGGPSNAASQPMERVIASIREAVDAALSLASIPRAQIQQFGFGLAGAESLEIRSRILAALEREFNTTNITLSTDARAALAGAAPDLHNPAMILIAGTGSVAFARDRTGREARAGGLGWLIGDEGSGFWIARRALEAVLRELDGRGGKTFITNLLAEKFSVKESVLLEKIINNVYRMDAIPGNVSSLFPLVPEAAAAGDAVALSILNDAARELGWLVTAVVEKLQLQNETLQISLLGGLWSAREWLEPPVREMAKRAAPRSEFTDAKHPAEMGAALLAMHDFTKKSKA